MRSNPSVAATAGPGVRTTEADWEQLLEEFFGSPIRVVYGSSRTTPVQARSYRPRGASKAGYEIRLHRMFASAPEEVRSALASWLRNGRRSRRASEVLDRWIHEELERIPAPERTVRVELRGRTYDLREMRDLVLATEFAHDFGDRAGREQPRITWGRRTRSRSRRSLRLGSYEPQSRVVRIHPVLDRPEVPDWFVRFVLKHEILHAVVESRKDARGRWIHHPPEFRERERSWPEYAPSVAWEEANLGRLIRWAREGPRSR